MYTKHSNINNFDLMSYYGLIMLRTDIGAKPQPEC